MKRMYNLRDMQSVRQLAVAVKGFLVNAKKMECQIVSNDMGNYIVQARAKHGRLIQWIGMDKAICVSIRQNGSRAVTVEIGKGEWLKKGLTMAASMVVLWPLFVTSGIGIVSQCQLPGEIDRFIQQYLTDADTIGYQVISR